MEYLNSKAELRIVPIGLAIPCPAISGAEPWMGSYNPVVVLKSGALKSEIVGAPAREAEGNNPREPGMTLDSSERLGCRQQSTKRHSRVYTHISPNKFSVSKTPFSFRGLEMINIEAESTK